MYAVALLSTMAEVSNNKEGDMHMHTMHGSADSICYPDEMYLERVLRQYWIEVTL